MQTYCFSEKCYLKAKSWLIFSILVKTGPKGLQIDQNQVYGIVWTEYLKHKSGWLIKSGERRQHRIKQLFL
jgi:hypothetical protein